MRFNYLHGGMGEALQRLRFEKIPAAMRPPLCAILTALFVAGGAFGLEGYRVDRARALESAAQVRVERSRALLAQTKIARTRVDSLLTLDSRLRKVRLSGSVLALRLIDIAGRVPSRAWLKSISRTASGISITGHAEGSRVLSDTIGNLMSSRSLRAPSLVRASAESNSQMDGLVSFEIRLQDGSK